ncbi:hypothetical protein D3C75_366530 [compost metagenome]
MDGKRYIVIAVPVDPVAVPAFSQIECIHPLQVRLQLLCVIGKPELFEAGIDQHIEEQPVAVIAGMGVDLIEPAVQLLLFLRSKRCPDLLRYRSQSEAEDRHLYQPLVVISHIAPIFVMCRIGAMPDAIQHGIQKRAASAAHQERHQPPQHAGKAFHLRYG